MARDSAEKLNVMVDDLLDLSRLAKDKLRMEVEPTALDELVRGAVERFHGAAAEKGLDLRLESPIPAIRAVVDGQRIGQVLSNLLSNAVKFTPGSGSIRVRLFASDDYPSAVAITVWNSGEPIEEPDLERILDRFEQARNDRTRRVRGTGLGLPISQTEWRSPAARLLLGSVPVLLSPLLRAQQRHAGDRRRRRGNGTAR